MDGTEVEIADVCDVGPETVAVTIEAPAGFDGQPGQFVQARATVDDEPVTRHYSISSPQVTDTFEVTVGIDPEGTLSPWLAAATPGDSIEVAGPFGRVYYEGEPSVVVLAAGPGIGPAVGVAERATLEGGEAAIVYRSAAPVHEVRLSGLAAAGADVYVVDDEEFEAAAEAALGEGQVFVYGFEPFIEFAKATLQRSGSDAEDAKIENFG